ncbi:MAG: Serine/threonine protein kinase [Gammaproteobacteria bacterium]|jgi:hypothetical protein|nr:Serine/threonine protein kinase [Gammaproteobacteria bacterium]
MPTNSPRKFTGHTDHAWSLLPLTETTFLSGSYDGAVKLWNIDNPGPNAQKTFICHPSNKVYALLGLTENTFASASSDNTIKIWELNSGYNIKTLAGHSKAIYSLAKLTDGKIVSQAEDSTIRIWNTESESFTGVIPDTTNYVCAVMVQSNNTIICEDNKFMIGMWDATTLQRAGSLGGHPNKHIRTQALMATNVLATGSCAFDIKIWDLRTAVCSYQLSGHENFVNAVTPLSEFYLASASGDKAIKVWDIRTGNCVATENTYHEGKGGWIQGLAKVGDWVVSASGDNTLGAWPVDHFLPPAPETTRRPSERRAALLAPTGGSGGAAAGSSGRSAPSDMTARQGGEARMFATLSEEQEHSPDALARLPQSNADASASIAPMTRATRALPAEQSAATMAGPRTEPRQNSTPGSPASRPLSALVMGSPSAARDDSSSSDSGRIEMPTVGATGRSKYHYYFISPNGESLICTIQCKNPSAIIDRPFIGSLLNTIYVFNLDSTAKVTFSTNFEQYMQVRFPNVSNPKIHQLIEQFIQRLMQWGIPELHENGDALWFYTNAGGDQILTYTNYPPSLQHYLREEFETCAAIIRGKPDNTVVVEVGCGELENLALTTVQSPHLAYIGFDFAAERILAANQKIAKQGIGSRVRAECFNILGIDRKSLKLRESQSPILLFPFNLFGNIAPISLLICRLVQARLECLISMYQNTPQALQMRRDYYTNCGYQHLESVEGPTGVVFKSDEGLYTVAYSEKYVGDLFRTFGYVVNVHYTTNGIVLHAVPPTRPLLPLSIHRQLSQDSADGTASPSPSPMAIQNQGQQATASSASPLAQQSQRSNSNLYLWAAGSLAVAGLLLFQWSRSDLRPFSFKSKTSIAAIASGLSSFAFGKLSNPRQLQANAPTLN